MRIDCGITENYLKEKDRMTHNCKIECEDCILYERCRVDAKGNEKSILEIVQKWSDEHPPKLTIKKAIRTLSNVNMVNHGDIRKALILALEEIKELKRRIND